MLLFVVFTLLSSTHPALEVPLIVLMMCTFSCHIYSPTLYVTLQLYSTVTLRQGEKKHYNNKVDVYSFGIVLWELLTNRMPFEGMSNLQAAYAAAFKVPKKPSMIFLLNRCMYL